MSPAASRSIWLVLVIAGLWACGGGAGGGGSADGTASADPARRDSAAVATARPGVAPADSALDRAARSIIAFLRGEGAVDRALLSDTVTLHVAPEGGGARRRVAREALLEPSGWTVGGRDLTPPAGADELTTRPGRHLACMEGDLSTRSEELGRLPHVGTMLRPPRAESCLQSWNLTLVFERDASPPRLVAALYDQWEW